MYYQTDLDDMNGLARSAMEEVAKCENKKEGKMFCHCDNCYKR